MTRDALGKTLLFIESNTTGTGRLFVRAARDIGCHPVLVTARPRKYAYLAEEAPPEVIVVARTDEDELAALIRDRFHGGATVAGITSSSEYFIATAAALAARFGLPGPDPVCVCAARDKAHQRHVLARAGLPAPRFQVASSVAEAEAAAREIGMPVIVKPTDGSGSVGVRACATVAEAGRHAASLLSRQDGPPGARVLVESIVEGPEFSVEMFSGRVIGITRKHLGPPPNFVETGHDYPVVPADAARMRQVVARAAALLGLTWGPLHWELRMHGGLAYVIEVNPRLAGGFIPELVRHAEGIDLIHETLRLTVGQPSSVESRCGRHASIRFFLTPAAGRLAALEGLDEARAIDGVVELSLYRAIGDALTLEGDFRDRIGHVIACADRADDAAATAERAYDAVRIRMTDVTRADVIAACAVATSRARVGEGVA